MDQHLKKNEARKLNHSEVVEEDRRNKLPANHEARKRRQEWELEELEKRKEAEERGEDYDRVKLLSVQADIADKLDASKKRKKNPDPGFSDFEQAAVRAYTRKAGQIKPDAKNYEVMKAAMGEEFYPTANTLIQGSHYPEREGIDRLVTDMEKQATKKAFSRRRTFDPDAASDSINERNRAFNAKIERFYGKYTVETKANLERGTAV